MRLRDFLLALQQQPNAYGDLKSVQARDNAIGVYGKGLSGLAIAALKSGDPNDVIDVLTHEAVTNGELASSVTYIGWAYFAAQ